MAPAYIDAAGSVVYRRRNSGKPEILIVHRPRYDDWSLPKGKLENGESFEECAVRETVEETGYNVKLGDPIGTVTYQTPEEDAKRVRYWLVKALAGSFAANGEVDEAAWLRPREARARLSYAVDRAVAGRGLQMIDHPKSGRIYLVRHALAGDRTQWKGKDRRRPLSKRGHAQAVAIRDGLTEVPLRRLLSSPHARCHDTLVPLAEALGVEIEHHAALGEGAATPRLLELVATLRGTTAVLCSHGDVIEGLIGYLGDDGTKIDGPMKWPKGSMWVLETARRGVRKARYLSPPK